MSGEWVKLGSCGVDSGQILLVDPCYIRGGIDYDQLCADWGDYSKKGFETHDGVVVSSGFGDGAYEVFALIRDCGQWGKRVAEVKIIFIEKEVLA